VDAKVLEKYVGKYEVTPALVLTISREGERLLVQPTGQPQVELRPQSDVKFFVKEAGAEVTFAIDGEGQVTHLTLHQGGRAADARRLD
jgi:hypothetical protein